MLKSILKKSLSVSTKFLSQDFLINLSGQRMIMPFYHTVSDNDLPHIKNLYPVIGVKQFNEDLDFFQKYYTAVNPDYLLSSIADKSVKKDKTFYISFDDGLREFHDVVVPILVKRGISATCFVNPAFVDNKDMFFRLKISIIIEKIKKKPLTAIQFRLVQELLFKYGIRYKVAEDLLRVTDKSKDVLNDIATCLEINFADYLSEHQPYLTSEQIKSVINKGFTIGTHSYNHPYYPFLSEDEQVEETLRSTEWLNSNFGIQSRLFAFPYTDFQVTKSFFKRIENDIDLSFGTANLKQDSIVNNFQRIPMEIEGRLSAKQLVKAEYLYFILKKMLGKHIIIRN